MLEASVMVHEFGGVEFYQNPRTIAPKDAPPKTDAPAVDPKEQAGPPKEINKWWFDTDHHTGRSSLVTGSKSQANLAFSA